MKNFIYVLGLALVLFFGTKYVAQANWGLGLMKTIRIVVSSMWS